MSSATYTLHVAPYGVPGDPAALERADIVRDGFAWWACLTPMLWFVRYRHWGLGLAALVAVAGLAAALWALGCRPPAIVAAEILLHVLIGFEASSLRRWAYGRRGRPVVDVVSATDAQEAETKSFRRWLEPGPQGPSGPAPLAGPPGGRPGPFGLREPEPVIGMFPEPGWPSR